MVRREQNPSERRNTQAGDERRKEIDSRPTREEEGKRGAEGMGGAKPTRANKQHNKKQKAKTAKHNKQHQQPHKSLGFEGDQQGNQGKCGAPLALFFWTRASSK